MLDRAIDIWGVNGLGLIALEYQVDPAYIDLNLVERYSELFHNIYPDFYIEYSERYGILLSPDDGWYLCCTQGDGAPVAVRHAQELTEAQMKGFANLSEDFYQTVNSILGDVDG